MLMKYGFIKGKGYLSALERKKIYIIDVKILSLLFFPTSYMTHSPQE